jgi:hypothetical protein
VNVDGYQEKAEQEIRWQKEVRKQEVQVVVHSAIVLVITPLS